MSCAKCMAVSVCVVNGPVLTDDFPLAKHIIIINSKRITLVQIECLWSLAHLILNISIDSSATT